MDEKVAAKLREKFDIRHVGKKPKITCGACSKAQGRVCPEHKKKQCAPAPDGCGQWITERHMHVDFVGHANVTDRLLEVDPAWTWEPMAVDADGLPKFDKDGGLWIRLTVAGVTRIGYGGADGKRGDDAVKEAIGDAIKVAAMRFGVALDLWRKEEASGKEPEAPTAQRTSSERRPSPATEAMKGDPAKARATLAIVCEEKGWDLGIVARRYEQSYNVPLGTDTDAVRIARFQSILKDVPRDELTPAATNGAPR